MYLRIVKINNNYLVENLKTKYIFRINFTLILLAFGYHNLRNKSAQVTERSVLKNSWKSCTIWAARRKRQRMRRKKSSGTHLGWVFIHHVPIIEHVLAYIKVRNNRKSCLGTLTNVGTVLYSMAQIFFETGSMYTI